MKTSIYATLAATLLALPAMAQDAGDLAAAGVYMLEAGMTTSQVANLWSPYLTMAEGLKLTAQAFTTDIAPLNGASPFPISPATAAARASPSARAFAAFSDLTFASAASSASTRALCAVQSRSNASTSARDGREFNGTS